MTPEVEAYRFTLRAISSLCLAREALPERDRELRDRLAEVIRKSDLIALELDKLIRDGK